VSLAKVDDFTEKEGYGRFTRASWRGAVNLYDFNGADNLQI